MPARLIYCLGRNLLRGRYATTTDVAKNLLTLQAVRGVSPTFRARRGTVQFAVDDPPAS